MSVLAIAEGVNELALVVFAIVLTSTLLITYWASKRTHTATEFWAASRGITGLQNGFAIAGDYLSASTFLGFAGLIFLFGVDGWVGLAAAGASFLPVILLLAERMRNSGKFTMADVLSFRLRERPARIVAALGTLVVSFVYLIAQMVGAGVLLQALAGIDFTLSVAITGTFMLIYVIFGGMLATTWVQIIKAGLLMSAGSCSRCLCCPRQASTPSSCSSGRPPRTRSSRATSPPACSTRTRSTRSPSGLRCCSAPPVSRTC
jgi:cation/acetate symporter